MLTTHAYEHKIFVPPFQRRYSTAQVWVVPRCAHSSGAALRGAGPGLSRVIMEIAAWSAVSHCDLCCRLKCTDMTTSEVQQL